MVPSSSLNNIFVSDDITCQFKIHVFILFTFPDFKYENDSVLVVNHTDYKECIVSNPITKFEDGNTILRIDRYGFFYFVSGQPGHCNAGQKLVIRVMVQSAEVHTPRAAPSPKENGDSGDDGWDSFNWGPPSLNSTVKMAVASYFLTILGGVLVIFYVFM
jgi:hypothetical protein